MNKKMISFITGRILILEAGLMILPLIISFLYNENAKYKIAYGTVILMLLATGFLLSAKTPEETSIQGREGYIIVSLSWILMSMFGALPFVITKEIPSFIDAFFEIVSGFTTTGSSIITDLSKISHSNLFWRSFTHFVGGMGVLVLALAIFPSSATSVHVMKAEVPGPTFGKLVSKLSTTARMLYKIYIVMTIVLIILLMFGGLNLFESSLLAFGTAGTGGFGVRNGSILPYNNPYIEIVLGIGMIVFGVNFNIYYFILIGKVKDVLKNEELRYYLLIVFGAITLIVLNICKTYTSLAHCIRDVFFSVSSVILSGHLSQPILIVPSSKQICFKSGFSLPPRITLQIRAPSLIFIPAVSTFFCPARSQNSLNIPSFIVYSISFESLSVLGLIPSINSS